MKTLEELRSMSDGALQELLIEIRKEQFVLRTQKAIGNLEKTHPFSQLRKTVARIKTLMTQRAGVINDK